MPHHSYFRWILCFNPRTREGATFEAIWRNVIFLRFNPRTREGATGVIEISLGNFSVSIHAPVRVRL